MEAQTSEEIWFYHLHPSHPTGFSLSFLAAPPEIVQQTIDVLTQTPW
jgi:hypothetical protein